MCLSVLSSHEANDRRKLVVVYSVARAGLEHCETASRQEVMTRTQQRRTKLAKQAESYKSRGYVKAGRSWVKAGSKAELAFKAMKRKSR